MSIFDYRYDARQKVCGLCCHWHGKRTIGKDVIGCYYVDCSPNDGGDCSMGRRGGYPSGGEGCSNCPDFKPVI